ncbi:unnamed protein product [Rhizoctonia solani]|nr:unnamed protein product [Rhizoctonia solani]
MLKFPNLSDQVFSPPELPAYLRNVHDLKLIEGVPSNDEMIGIHTVIRVANKVVDVQGVGDPGLHARLSEYLFETQMGKGLLNHLLSNHPVAKYRSKYLCTFTNDVTYMPPVLPGHISVNLEPIFGSPSEDQVIKVHEAMRSYQKYSESK